MAGSCVVIGGGILGSAIAFELQGSGVETVLVERDTEAQGASAFSFASLSAFGEPQRDVYLLKAQGMIGWRQWTKSFGDALGVRWDGEIRWAENAEAAKQLDAQIERALSRGYPVQRMSRTAIIQRLPAVQPGEVSAASYASADGQADPVRTMKVLRSAFLKQGGKLLVGKATLILTEDRVAVGVGEDRIDPERVVVAAGAETAALLDRFGWDTPMDPSPGLLVVTSPVQPTLVGAVYVFPEQGPGVHLRQLPDGRLLIGEESQEQVAKEPTMDHAERLLHQAVLSIPALRGADIDHFTVEWRPMPRDGMPIVGPLPGLGAVYVVTAHSGVTIAPALGRLVAQEIAGREQAPLLEAFRPGRFGAHQAEADMDIEEIFTAPPESFLG